MALNYISAAEAASLIKHGYNIGLSGFTPAGTAKAVTAELAKIAEAEHAKGNPFQIGIFTGASTGDSCDGILSKTCGLCAAGASPFVRDCAGGSSGHLCALATTRELYSDRCV